MSSLLAGDDAVLLDRLREIWHETLSMGEIGPDDQLPDLATRSMTVIKLAVRVNEAFAVEVPLDVFVGATTLRALAEAVRALSSPAP